MGVVFFVLLYFHVLHSKLYLGSKKVCCYLWFLFILLFSIKKWYHLEILCKSSASQYVAMFFHVGVLYFCFSCNKCFIRIAILCACGSRRFNPPTFFGRKIVFLAICSCLFFQIYLKIFSCVICAVCTSIGNTLLRKEVFDSISVFAIFTFPLRESIHWESLCV